MKHAAGLLSLPSLVIACAVACATPLYTVTPIGALGGSTAAAVALNDLGNTAGYASNSLGYVHAFLSASSSFSVLGPPGVDTQAAGINDAGQVAGTTYTAAGARATVWQGNTTTGLGTLGGADSVATAISDNGTVAGASLDASGNQRAFLYSQGAMRNLGTLAGTDWSAAYAVNQSGQAAGYTLDAWGSARAFEWSGTTGMTQLAGLAGSSYAMGINDAGLVVGSALAPTGYLHAVAWASGAVRDLGTLGGGNSYAYGVNDSGDIVGYSYYANPTGASAVLYRDGTAIDLNTILAPGSGSGWVLEQAYAINDAGQIAGAGIWNGEAYAFRLDPVTTSRIEISGPPGIPSPGVTVAPTLCLDPPTGVPEPATFGCIGVALVGLSLLSRRASRASGTSH